MSALIELAERCEAAAGDETEVLLQEAFDLVFPQPKEEDEPEWQGPGTLRQPLYHHWLTRKMLFSEACGAEAFLSAAVLLVPEGYKWAVTSRSSACCDEQGAVTGPLTWVFAATPALALTDASLQARARMEGK